MALAAEPASVLGQPTRGMESRGATDCTVGRQLKRDFTIVMIEHDMEFLFSLADQSCDSSGVIAQGTPGELQADRWVQQSIMGVKQDASRSIASTPFTARPKHSSARLCGSPKARRSRCSVRTAPEKRRCCARFWGSTRARQASIRFVGKEITKSATSDIACAGIGWVPDDRRIFPALKVKTNLALGKKRTPFEASPRKKCRAVPCARTPARTRE